MIKKNTNNRNENDNGKTKINNVKDENEFSAILTQMEQLLQGKLDSLKSTIPTLFTIVSSILAFLFVEDLSGDESNYVAILVIIGVGLLLLLFITIANFSVLKYPEFFISFKMSEDFTPWDIGTYIWTGDEEFLDGMFAYCGRDLTELEIIRIRILKGKVNEFRRKNFLLVLVQGMIMLGVTLLILAVGFLIF